MARKTCERCPECFAKGDDTNLPVCGDGPGDSKVLFIGDSPYGVMERNIGRPFIGKHGEEFDGLYLPLAGLSRCDVRVDNALRCYWNPNDDDPPETLVRSCSNFHLKPWIQQHRPGNIILMGPVANSLIGIDSVEKAHGSFWKGELFEHTATLFSSFHSSIGLGMANRMQSLIDDFRLLRHVLRKEIQPLVDDCPNPVFRRLRTAKEVDEVLEPEDGFEPMGVDTESTKKWKGFANTVTWKTYCLQFCVRIGKAFLILAEDFEAVARFAYHVKRFRTVLLHNAPHDVRELSRLGVFLDWARVVDTMALAYNEGRVQKGLKGLSYALLASTMRTFDDLVRPHGIKAAMEYFEEASYKNWTVPTPQPTGEFYVKACPTCKGKTAIRLPKGPTGRRTGALIDCPECGATGSVTAEKLSRPQGVGSKISRIIGDYLKTQPGDEKFDPWDRWSNWPEEQIEELVAGMGGAVPLASVDLVPYEELEKYAGSDPHSTKRVYSLLLKKLAGVAEIVKEHKRSMAVYG